MSLVLVFAAVHAMAATPCLTLAPKMSVPRIPDSLDNIVYHSFEAPSVEVALLDFQRHEAAYTAAWHKLQRNQVSFKCCMRTCLLYF